MTEAALGQRRPSLASCFLGELIHRPTGRWSFPKRGLPPSFRSPDSMALREEGKAPSPKATAGWGGVGSYRRENQFWFQGVREVKQ